MTGLAQRANQLNSLLERSKEQIAKALPRHITPERMIRVALTAARKDSKIMNCDPLTVVGAVVEASQLGLEPDGALGYAYLVPYGNKCTLIPGYRGLIALAKRTGKVANIYANVVHEGDEFTYEEGLHRDLKHKPDLSAEPDPSRILFVYAVITFKDGSDPDFEVMTVGQVNAIRDRSRAGSGPWKTDYAEMARKTAIRRLLKRHDLSPEVQRAHALESAAEQGAPITGVAEAKKPSDDEKLMKLLESDQAPEPEDGPEDGPEDLDDYDFGMDSPEPEPVEEPPTEPEDPESEQPKQPDRRQRKTCVAEIKKQVKRIGKDAAIAIRNRIVPEDVTPNPETMDIGLLRKLTRALESA